MLVVKTTYKPRFEDLTILAHKTALQVFGFAAAAVVLSGFCSEWLLNCSHKKLSREDDPGELSVISSK